jgi:hypothetical protein
MPTAINNGLPHIAFDLGASESHIELCGLMDACGALNTGCLTFHLWLKSERPDLLATKFIDSTTPTPLNLSSLVALFVTIMPSMPPIMATSPP